MLRIGIDLGGSKIEATALAAGGQGDYPDTLAASQGHGVVRGETGPDQGSGQNDQLGERGAGTTVSGGERGLERGPVRIGKDVRLTGSQLIAVVSFMGQGSFYPL